MEPTQPQGEPADGAAEEPVEGERDADASGYTEEEESVIAKRLEDLGYL